MKLMRLLKELKAKLKAKLLNLWHELTTFDLQFSLEVKVIMFMIGLFASDSSDPRVRWTRNILASIFLLISSGFYFWDSLEFNSFEMKLFTLVGSIVFIEVMTKQLVFVFNMKRVKLLNERISNYGGYFEEQMNVELPYRKLMRGILMTLIIMTTLMVFACLPIVPFQLPQTSRPTELINIGYNFACLAFAGVIYAVFELCFCLVSLFVISKISVCNFYIEQIGKFEPPFETEDLQSKLITKCGVFYEKIMTLIDDANSIFHLALLAQFLGTYASFVGYAHLFYKEFNFFFCSGAVLAITPLALTCLISGLITSKLENLSQSVYCSKWYEFTSGAERKKILMLLRMTQKEKGFSIGGFALIGFVLFAAFMKQAYSYFNVLREIS